MRKTHKKALGFLGLVFVAAITIFATTLPSPSASATTTSVTDTIQVRVVGSVPSVEILGIDNGEETLLSTQDFSVRYENSDVVTISLSYTDMDGVVHEFPIDTIDADYNAGEVNFSIQASDYGYGNFVINIKGTGANGVYDEDQIIFHYLPLTADAAWDEGDGGYNVEMDYNAEDGSTGDTGDVASIVVNVYDENGNPVKIDGFPLTITPPDKDFFVPFEDADLPSGKYTIEISSYDGNGGLLYNPYIIVVDYKAPETIPSPNTGGLFQNLNISKTDYLVTGLIIFTIVGVGGAAFINKRGRKGSGRRR